MEIIYLVIGLCVGIAAGYLAAARKAGVLQTKLDMQQSHAQDLLTAEQQRNAVQQELIKQELRRTQQKQEETLRLLETARQELAALSVQKKTLEEKLDNQKEEVANLHKQFNLEFENIANKIFQQKTESFNKLSAESLSNILKPFGENLNEFKHQVSEVYDKESKQRFSLEDRIKELVQLNKQISDDATCLEGRLQDTG